MTTRSMSPLFLPVTRRQLQVLRFVARYQGAHGFCPSIREIGTRLSIKSTNGVADHLRALERKGCLTRAAGKARTMVLTLAGRRELGTEAT